MNRSILSAKNIGIIICVMFLWFIIMNYKYFLSYLHNKRWNDFFYNAQYAQAFTEQNISIEYQKNADNLFNLANDIFKIWENKEDKEEWSKLENETSLSEKEKEWLKEHLEYLQQEEQENQEFFNKQEQDDGINSFIPKQFLEDPFFENIFDRWEKDW